MLYQTGPSIFTKRTLLIPRVGPLFWAAGYEKTSCMPQRMPVICCVGEVQLPASHPLALREALLPPFPVLGLQSTSETV